ncbi:MAG: hypothetical protein KZQ82_17745 [Candidatus Thiodiazotropha sp. (ex Lucinoma annulata)]|nr:hypothetical protein [Candidatus Thiodiazotropha sp. (ex Lucinoma annulata)]
MKFIFNSKMMTGMIVVLAGILFSGNVISATSIIDRTLVWGEASTFSHLGQVGAFSDTANFTTPDIFEGAVSVSIVDTEIALLPGALPLVDISEFIAMGPSGFLLDLGSDLASAAFSLNGLSAGTTYGFTFSGEVSGAIGGEYNVMVGAVPLPAAVWLFGSAILGFVTYSARRSV